MCRLETLNLGDVWQKELGWNAKKKSGRKFDDEIELKVWENLAPIYSKKYNLYQGVPKLKNKIHSILGKGNKILDLGCGCGNFAIPLASTAKEILALDFSSAMLQQLALKIKEENIHNIRMVCSKWEDFQGEYQADFVLSVNSLYRICYMRKALSKMVLYGKKGFVIVRTIIRPSMYSIYHDLGINYKKYNDYILVPAMLLDMGINANVDFIRYEKSIEYPDWEHAEEEMLKNLGELTYLNFSDQLRENFLQRAKKENNRFIFPFERVIQIISYVK